jgi:hypothetical protein
MQGGLHFFRLDKAILLPEVTPAMAAQAGFGESPFIPPKEIAG